MKYLFFIAAFLTLGANCADADQIELRTGQIIDGEITGVSAEQIEFSSPKQKYNIPFRKIAKISESSLPGSKNTVNLAKAQGEFQKVLEYRNQFQQHMLKPIPAKKIEIFIADAAATTPEQLSSGTVQAIGSARTAKKVELYMTSWCPWCVRTVEFLDSQGIQYAKYDIEKDSAAEKRYGQFGGQGVPLVVVGDQVIKGYNPDAIKAILEK